MRVVYPGSFDPMTNGHLDIVERASRLFDQVIVAVHAPEPSASGRTFLLSLEERVATVQECTSGILGVQVEPFSGLLVDVARAAHASAIIRGIRGVADLERETVQAQANRGLAPEIEVLWLPARPDLTYMSASVVREIARLGGPIDHLVPSSAAARLRALRRKEALQ